MSDQTNWTPFPDDNFLGISDKDLLNELEAKGIAFAEMEIFETDVDAVIDVQFILKLHAIAFEELYEWGGKWRKVNVTVGGLRPPNFQNIPNLMYQFVENLSWKISNSKERNDIIDALIYAHYEFVKIHPFNNGNGRVARLILNLVAMKFGFQPIELYHREGESRGVYISALQKCDNGDFEELYKLIDENLISF